jgi:hypothetical protein
MLLVTGHRGRILWDPDRPEALTSFQSELEQADAAAVSSIHEDLVVVDRHSRALRAALEGTPLPQPPADTGQSGYTYLHRERAMIAYNLHESGMERLHGPALPYARAMLGARTAHEWAHLAVLAGCVPCNVDPQRFAALEIELANELDATIAAAPAGIRSRTAPDLAKLAPGQTPGTALARLLLTRMPDYQSNLLAGRFLDSIERETYVRHNIRSLRASYAPAELWRMLVRYLFEYQYLGLSAVADRPTYLFRSTWFEQDFIASGALDERRFDGLAAVVGKLCACYRIDATRVRLPTPGSA